MIWNRILETYENNKHCADIAPVAHCKIKAHIGVLIDRFGIFRMAAELPSITTIIPCTAESECRGSNVAPHPIHDNLSYVGNLPGYDDRHKAYMEQLRKYAFDTDCKYAKSIYKYISKGTLMDDISDILDNSKSIKNKDIKSINVVFLVHHEMEDAIDLNWTDYYLSNTTKNGTCALTGEPDYIPKSYPILKCNSTDLTRLFIASPNERIDSARWSNEFRIGYIASQKIIHTLQALMEDDKSYLDDDVKFLNQVFSTVELN